MKRKWNWNTLMTNKFQFILTQIEIDIKASIHVFDNATTMYNNQILLSLGFISTFSSFDANTLFQDALLHCVENVCNNVWSSSQNYMLYSRTCESSSCFSVTSWSHAAGQCPLLMSRLANKSFKFWDTFAPLPVQVKRILIGVERSLLKCHSHVNSLSLPLAKHRFYTFFPMVGLFPKWTEIFTYDFVWHCVSLTNANSIFAWREKDSQWNSWCLVAAPS